MLIDATHLKLIKPWGCYGNEAPVRCLVMAGYASYITDKPSWA